MKETKIIVAGGRDFNDYGAVESELREIINNDFLGHSISIVSGKAKGADSLGIRFAEKWGMKTYEFPAEWDNLDVPNSVIKYTTYGKPYNAVAGHNRNRKMAEFADVLVAFWDGKSRGTKNMIKTMERMGKEVYVAYY